MLRTSIATALLLCLPQLAQSQDIWATSPKPDAAQAAPSSAQAASVEVQTGTYDATVLSGTRKIVVRDFAGAIALLRDAAAREPNRPEAFCRIADAELAQGDLTEARAGYESCERFASADQDAHHVTLALVGLARVLERENKPREEREGWLRVASVSREEAALALAQARVAVLDALNSQENAYQPVRQRLADAAKAKAATP